VKLVVAGLRPRNTEVHAAELQVDSSKPAVIGGDVNG